MMPRKSTRTQIRALLALAGLLVVGACADNSTAPGAKARPFVAPANYDRIGDVVEFRVDNSVGATKIIGSHVLSMPAGSICDLETSGYGSTEWDQPCAPLQGSVVITATVMYNDDNQPYVDFQPAMRFAPDKEVVLFLVQGYNSAKTELLIEYCTNLGSCYDESDTDPSLKPFRVGSTPVLGRRLKHFSGYIVISGEACNGTVTDNGDGTYWCEEGMSRRSGYMVASGEDITDVIKDAKEENQQ
jgi:hypothetical protein